MRASHPPRRARERFARVACSKIIKESPKPLRANLSKQLRELIMHMLAKQPKDRPTAREIADMLHCKIAVRPPMPRSVQPRVGRCVALEGRHRPGARS